MSLFGAEVARQALLVSHLYQPASVLESRMLTKAVVAEAYPWSRGHCCDSESHLGCWRAGSVMTTLEAWRPLIWQIPYSSRSLCLLRSACVGVAAAVVVETRVTAGHRRQKQGTPRA